MRAILDWWKRLDTITRLRASILVALFLVGLFFTLSGMNIGYEPHSVLLNLGTELIGASITFFLIDQVLHKYEQREARQRAEQISKTELIARMGSSIQNFAVSAAEEMRRHGWLTDDSLHNVSLLAANLQRAPLSYAQLQGANLGDADLQHADLSSANLRLAHLDGANLQGAYMSGADLQGASLVSTRLGGADLREACLNEAELIMADLQQANLRQARLNGAYLSTACLYGAALHQADLRGVYGRSVDLRGANLSGALLEGASLEEALFDGYTILPDGTNWSPDLDIHGMCQTCSTPETRPTNGYASGTQSHSTRQTPPPSSDDLLDSLLHGL